ncbi:hypothetical protein RIF29_40328 [Crotalaria pallida]|uniref:Endonuclease/exonuclease/phosphatase n=1 Tax=Crotalaria pallida TaxID=3830 RepID=A0AAN9E994_CROPI
MTNCSQRCENKQHPFGFSIGCKKVADLRLAKMLIKRGEVLRPCHMLARLAILLQVNEFSFYLIVLDFSGGMFLRKRANNFHSVAEDCRLIDIGAMGSKFKWVRREGNSRLIQKRFDRVLVDIDWRHAFPKAHAENLCRVQSDHSPILLRCSGFVPTRNFR